MALVLPRLPQSAPSHGEFQVWWQQVVEKIEEHNATQDTILDRIRRINSHTSPTTILQATEDGATATIVVLDHTRVYADGTTVAITGGTQTGFAGAASYACYYDDTTLADTTPTFVFTTDMASAAAASTDGRHFCGIIKTPALASGKTISSGGAYPASSSFGGELL